MKVGVFVDSYQPEDGGGYTMQSEIFRALSRLHAKSSHEFVIFSPPNRQIVEEARNAGLKWVPYQRPGFFEKTIVFFVRNFPSLRGRLKWRSAFERKARKDGIEFIWFLGPRPHTVDLPYLTIVLDLQHRKQPWFPEVGEYGEWEARERQLAPFLQRAAGIITGTNAGKQEIVRFFGVPEERIHLLPHPTPVYINSVSAADRLPQSGLPANYLFYPAQFWAHKNHVNLLMALKQLKDSGLEIPLVLTGSDFGNLGFLKQRIEELGLTGQVKFLGFVDSADLVALYRDALALVYVSFFGPENLPPLEAFAVGCPVIASRVDGAEEQLGDAAMLVSPDSPEEIASAIRRLHDDPSLRQELIARGRQRARWSTDDFVTGAFKILDQFEAIRRNWGN